MVQNEDDRALRGNVFRARDLDAAKENPEHEAKDRATKAAYHGQPAVLIAA